MIYVNVKIKYKNLVSSLIDLYSKFTQIVKITDFRQFKLFYRQQLLVTEWNSSLTIIKTGLFSIQLLLNPNLGC